MRFLPIFPSLLFIILCSLSMRAQIVFTCPLQPRPRAENTEVVIPGWDMATALFDEQSKAEVRHRQRGPRDWLVASDHQFVAILADHHDGLSKTLHVLDDGKPHSKSKLIAAFSSGRFRGLGVIAGIVWVATDSIYSFSAQTGLRLASMALPAEEGILRVAATHLLWIGRDAVRRFEYDAHHWQTLLHWELGPDDEEAYILDALERHDGLFVLVHHQSKDDRREQNRLWKFAEGRCLEMSKIVHSLASTHIFAPRWRIEDVSSGIAHTQNREIVTIGQYNLSSTTDPNLYSGRRIHRGRIWGLDKYSSIESYGSDGKVDRSFPIPLLPTNRKYYDMFCLDNRCYINTDAGVFSAPYQKGVVDPERRSSLDGLLRELPNGRLLLPFAGELSLIDLQGRLVLNSSVETGEYAMPTLACGVYCAILAGTNGRMQRLAIVR